VIRHVVVFALRADDQAQKRTDARAMKQRLEALSSVVPGVRSLQVGIDLGRVSGHWDVVLVSDHDSVAALEAYQVHPDHVAAAEFVSSVVADKACVDYDVGPG
jgi:hypothetical protein